MARYAAEEATAAAEPLHAVRATLLESGALLYLHTAAGGAAWGLFESLRGGQPVKLLVQNVVRTSLVTCFVPILMVGGVVTTYNRMNKQTDTVNEKFYLFFGLCMGAAPAPAAPARAPAPAPALAPAAYPFPFPYPHPSPQPQPQPQP